MHHALATPGSGVALLLGGIHCAFGEDYRVAVTLGIHHQLILGRTAPVCRCLCSIRVPLGPGLVPQHGVIAEPLAYRELTGSRWPPTHPITPRFALLRLATMPPRAMSYQKRQAP